MNSNDVARIIVTLFNNKCLNASLLTISSVLEKEFGFDQFVLDNAIDKLLVPEFYEAN